MLRTRNGRYCPRRRGMILLVVLTLLTLFALVGISFVLVAGSQETSARIAREAETQFKPGVDPEGALALALGQLLYDQKDDIHGARSALRGHSLARSMYGWWDGANPGQTDQSFTLNDKPFTGTGRLHADAAPYRHPLFNPPGTGYYPPACSSDAFILNFLYHSNDGFVRDPERLGWRGSPADSFSTASPDGSRWHGGTANVPYTYPDHKNFFLAQIDPNDGLILVPSFHREYLFGRLDLPPNDPPGAVPAQEQVTGGFNSNWVDSKAKYLTLRPTPAHHNENNDPKRPTFPMPVDRFGDVKNLDGFPGGADSIWIDIGSPVMVAPQMRSTRDPLKPLRYKMMLAPLILELDSRVNLNVVGNWLGKNATTPAIREHRSNQGWGLWEVNPSKILNYADSGQPAPQEWLNIFFGSEGSNLARIRGRHDSNATARRIKGRPLGAGGGQGARVWGQVDYDGLENSTARGLSTRIRKPLSTDTDIQAGSWFFGLPIFPGPTTLTPADQTYQNGGIENYDAANTNDIHPSAYNTLRTTGPNRRFPVSDMAQLLRFGGSGSDAMASDLLRLLPNNLIKDGGALRRRNLVTLLSADLDRPGVPPYIWKPDANDNAPPGGTTDPTNPADDVTRLRLRFEFPGTSFPVPNPAPPTPHFLGIPSLTWGNPAPPAPLPAYTNPADGNAPIPFPQLNQRPSTPAGEFDGRTWRSTLGNRGRIDLGRAAVLPYPTQRDIENDTSTGKATTTELTRKATVSRQALAGDIFETLRRVTGAMPTNDAYAYAPGNGQSEEFNAIRYLAQLAVNIVDYVDSDDISTPFAIPGLQGAAAHTEWVFGFELPRLVINEVFAQYDNDLASMQNNNTEVNPTGTYALNVWAELKNPLPEDRLQTPEAGTPSFPYAIDGIARLYYEHPTDATGAQDYPIYRLLLADAAAASALRDPANTLGDPNYNRANPAMPLLRTKGIIGRPVTPTTGNPYINWSSTSTRGTGIQYVRPMPAANRYNDQGPITTGDPALGANEKLGFILVGPKTRVAAGDFPGRFDWVEVATDEPTFPALTLASPDMTWDKDNDPDTVKKMQADQFDLQAEVDRPRPMVVLQRLANPRRPHSDLREIDDETDPSSPKRKIPNPNYNPFVTVDYHESHQHQVEYGRRFVTPTGTLTPPQRPRDQRVSWGRNQPFAAFSAPYSPAATPDYTVITNSPRKPQAPNAAGAVPEAPKHTFLRQNSVESDPTMFATQATDPAGTPAPWLPPTVLPQGSLKKPFDWLTHLDRAPISAGELLHVSALRPYDVLQYFVVRDEQTPTPSVQQHKAPWLDPRARLYRFLEFVSAVNDPYRFDGIKDPTDPTQPPPPPLPAPYNNPPYNADPYTDAGNLVAPGFWGRPNSRVQGKINLNMVMSPEVLYALADSNPDTSTAGNTFTKMDLDNIFNAMLVETDPAGPAPKTTPSTAARTPKAYLGASIGWRAMAGPTDRRLIGNQFSPLWPDVANYLNKPMWGLAMGHATNVQNNDPFLYGEDVTAGVVNRGLPQTALRSSGTNLMLDNLEDASRTPPKTLPFLEYQKKELLTKIFNNFTTRSNVFAVWFTFGFFEVVDEAATPVKLGSEVGKAENRHVRYRMFSIVDRTQMTAFSTGNRKGWFASDQHTKPGTPAPTATTADQAPGTEIALDWSRTVLETSAPPEPLPPTPQPNPLPARPLDRSALRYFVRDGRTGREWEVTDGTILVYDNKGDNEEAVVVKSYVWINPGNVNEKERRLYANFMRAHGDGAPVICHGNPGPMDRYDPRKDTDVVPFFQLID